MGWHWFRGSPSRAKKAYYVRKAGAISGKFLFMYMSAALRLAGTFHGITTTKGLIQRVWPGKIADFLLLNTESSRNFLIAAASVAKSKEIFHLPYVVPSGAGPEAPSRDVVGGAGSEATAAAMATS